MPVLPDFHPDPSARGQPRKDPTHPANFGVDCELVYPGVPNEKHAGMEELLIGKLME